MNFVIRNIKKKCNLHEALKWYEHKATVIKAHRISGRGKEENIFVIGADHGYGLRINTNHAYISDTGMGHGGNGCLQIMNIIEADSFGNIEAVANPVTLNEKEKLPLWVMV